MSDSKTATERLREMLDARGVDYEANRIDFDDGYSNIYTEWGDDDNASYIEYVDGTVLRIFGCTPEQAVAATLGSGECENTSKLNHSSVAGYYFTCSECGLSVGTSMNIRETDLVTPTCFRWGELYKFERCPRCGKAVKR